jgi:hypothetical protein
LADKGYILIPPKHIKSLIKIEFKDINEDMIINQAIKQKLI